MDETVTMKVGGEGFVQELCEVDFCLITAQLRNSRARTVSKRVKIECQKLFSKLCQYIAHVMTYLVITASETWNGIYMKELAR